MLAAGGFGYFARLALHFRTFEILGAIALLRRATEKRQKHEHRSDALSAGFE